MFYGYNCFSLMYTIKNLCPFLFMHTLASVFLLQYLKITIKKKWTYNFSVLNKILGNIIIDNFVLPMVPIIFFSKTIFFTKLQGLQKLLIISNKTHFKSKVFINYFKFMSCTFFYFITCKYLNLIFFFFLTILFSRINKHKNCFDTISRIT